jgi:WD40 repeat protein
MASDRNSADPPPPHVELRISLAGNKVLLQASDELGGAREHTAPAPHDGPWFLDLADRIRAALAEATIPADILDRTRRAHDAVFGGEVGRLYQQARGRAQTYSGREPGALSVRLSVLSPGLRGVPWEALNEGGASGFLGVQSQLRVSRTATVLGADGQLRSTRDLEPRKMTGAVRIRLLAPTGGATGALEDALAGARRRGLLAWVPPVLGESARRQTFRSVLLQERELHLLHFLGHGDVDAGGTARLRLADEPTGAQAWVPAENMARALEELSPRKKSLRLVYLDACEGAAVTELTSAAEVFVRHLSQAAIAHLFPIDQGAARILAEAFYEAFMGSDDDDDDAAADGAAGDAADSLRVARNALLLAGDRPLYAFSPVLYVRQGTTRLFDFSERTTTPPEAPQTTAPPPNLPRDLVGVLRHGFTLVLGDRGEATRDARAQLEQELRAELARHGDPADVAGLRLSALCQRYGLLDAGDLQAKTERIFAGEMAAPDLVTALARHARPGVHVSLLWTPALEVALATMHRPQRVIAIHPPDIHEQGRYKKVRVVETDWTDGGLRWRGVDVAGRGRHPRLGLRRAAPLRRPHRGAGLPAHPADGGRLRAGPHPAAAHLAPRVGGRDPPPAARAPAAVRRGFGDGLEPSRPVPGPLRRPPAAPRRDGDARAERRRLGAPRPGHRASRVDGAGRPVPGPPDRRRGGPGGRREHPGLSPGPGGPDLGSGPGRGGGEPVSRQRTSKRQAARVSDNPFPGARPYRREDEGVYPDRPTELARVLDAALAYRCLLLHGPSSAGKSSLMAAAVSPALERLHHHRVLTIDQWPEDDDELPAAHLVRALSQQLDLKLLPDVPLAEALEDLLDRAAEQSETDLLVYLDQTEQLLYPSRDPHLRRDTFELVDQLVAAPGGARVVLGIREDYVGLFRHHVRRWPRLLEHSLRIGTLTVEEMSTAVCIGAEKGGQDWDLAQLREVVRQMCAPGQVVPPAPSSDAAPDAGATGAPPGDGGKRDDREVESAYVQIVCRTLFQERRGKAPDDWPALRPPEEIVRTYLDRSLEDLDAPPAEGPLSAESPPPPSLGEAPARLSRAGGPQKLSDRARDFLERELVDDEGRRRVRTEQEVQRLLGDDVRERILTHLAAQAIVRWQSHGAGRLLELGHDWLAARLLERKRLRLEAEQESAQKDAAARARKDLELSALQAKQQAQAALVEKLEAEKQAKEDSDRRAAAEQAAAKERQRTSRIVLAVRLGAVLMIAIAVGYAVWNGRRQELAEADRRAKQAEVDRQIDRGKKLASTSTLLLADGKIDHAVRGLQMATEFVADVAGPTAQRAGGSASADLISPIVLASRRTLALTGGAWVAAQAGRDVRNLVIAERGPRAVAALLADSGSSVRLRDLLTGREWPADDPGEAPSVLPELKHEVERAEGFSGPIEHLQLPQSGLLAVARGSKGHVAIWRVVDGQLLGRYRTRTERIPVLPSEDGRTVLFWEEPGDTVFLMRPGLDRPLELRGENKGRSSGAVDQGAWPWWEAPALTPDGGRVLRLQGTRRASRLRGRQPTQTLHVWDTSRAVPAAPGEEADSGLAPSASIPLEVDMRWYRHSPDAAWLAIVSRSNALHVWDLSSLGGEAPIREGHTARFPSDVQGIWFGSVGGEALVIAGAGDTLFGYRAEALIGATDAAPAKAAFEIPLGATARQVEVGERDGKMTLLVWTQDEALLYTAKDKSAPLRLDVLPADLVALPELPGKASSPGSPRPERESSLSLFFAPGPVIATANGKEVRMRAAGEIRRDRLVWTRTAGAPPVFSDVIAPHGFVEQVVATGQGLAALAGGQVFSVALTKPRPDSPDAERPPERGMVDIDRLYAAADTLAGTTDAGELVLLSKARPAGAPGGARKEVLYRVGLPSFGVYDTAPLVAPSPGGAWVATAGWSARVYMWEARTGFFAWSADVRRPDNSTPLQITSYSDVTALAAWTKSPRRPWALAGHHDGSVNVLGTRTDKIGWFRRRLLAPGDLHGKAVTVASASDDGHLATGAADGTLAFWDPSERRVPLNSACAEDGSPVRVAKITRWGAETVLVSGSAAGRVQVSIASGQACCKLEHGAGVVDLEVTSTSSGAALPDLRIFVRDEDRTATVWTLSSDCTATPGRVFRGVQLASFVPGARSGDPLRLATVSPNGRLDIWEEGEETNTAPGPQGTVSWGAFAGGALVVGDARGKVFRFREGPDSRDPEEVKPPEGVKGDFLGRASVAEAGGRFAVVGENGQLLDWAGKTPAWSKVAVERGHHVRGAALTGKDRLRLVAETASGELRHATGTLPRGSLPVPGPWKPLRAPAPGEDPCERTREPGAKEAEERLLTAVALEDTLWTIVAEKDGCLRMFDDEGNARSARGPSSPTALALSRRGDRLVVGSRDGSVSLWSLSLTGPAAPSGALGLQRLALDRQRHRGAVRAVAFHPDGRFAVTASDDGEAWLWDAQEGLPFVRLGAHPAQILWARFDPDGGDRLVTGGADGWIRAWDTRTHEDDLGSLARHLGAWLP